MTLRELYEEGVRLLTEHGVPDAGLDARILLCEAFDMDTGAYLRSCEEELSEETGERELLSERLGVYEHFLSCRCGRMPLQQILGSAQFMGLSFAVNRNVLIPRQDTETLVEEVLSDFPHPELSVLDMCTGSGCIAVSLAVLGGYRFVVGADLSAEALCTAQENAERLLAEAEERRGHKNDLFGFFSGEAEEPAQELRFVQTDLFSGFPELLPKLGLEQFDLIVSNPPYIRSKEIEELLPEVRDYEPRMALDGSEDGLWFYRRIAAECRPYLRDGGSLYLEIGADEAKAVSGILSEAGFERISVVKDLCGNDRVVKAGK